MGGRRAGGEVLQILDCKKIRLWGDCGVGHGVGNLDLLVKARRMMCLRNLFGQVGCQILLRGVAV